MVLPTGVTASDDADNVQVASSCTILDHLDQTLNNANFADVQFVVGEPGIVICAHRAILCRNPVFAALFEGGFEECSRQGSLCTIPIADVNADAFRMLLRIVYSGRIDMAAPICTLCELLTLTDMYGVPDATSVLAHHIGTVCAAMNADEAYRCLETAHMITAVLPGKPLVLQAWPVLRSIPVEALPTHPDFWVNLSAYLIPIYPPLALGIISVALQNIAAEDVPALLESRLGPKWLEHLTYRETVRYLADLKLLPLPMIWALSTAERRGEALRDIVASRDVTAMLHLAQELPGCTWDVAPELAHRVACAGPRLVFSDCGDGALATNVHFGFSEGCRFLPTTKAPENGILPTPPPGPLSSGLFKVSIDVVHFCQEMDLSGGYLGFGVVSQEYRHLPVKCIEPRTDRKFLAVYCKVRAWRESEGLVRNGDGKFTAVASEGLHPGDHISLLLDLINGYLWILRGDSIITTFRLSLSDRYSVCVFGGHSGCILELAGS